MKHALFATVLAFSMVSGAQAELVTHDDGGFIGDAILKSIHLMARRETFAIDGPCTSACTMTADLARPYTCLRPRAVFYFHRITKWKQPPTFIRNFNDGRILRIEGSISEKNVDAVQYYSPDIQSWINAQGGLPADSSNFLEMPYRTARLFFRPCTWKERWG